MDDRPSIQHVRQQPFDQEMTTETKNGYATSDIQQQAQVVLEDTPEARARERAYIWKLDCIILPTISALYFFEYIDRGNIAVRSSILCYILKRRKMVFLSSFPVSHLLFLLPLSEYAHSSKADDAWMG
jgi:hypothetical protein